MKTNKRVLAVRQKVQQIAFLCDQKAKARSLEEIKNCERQIKLYEHDLKLLKL